jgi:hypothetical protein
MKCRARARAITVRKRKLKYVSECSFKRLIRRNYLYKLHAPAISVRALLFFFFGSSSALVRSFDAWLASYCQGSDAASRQVKTFIAHKRHLQSRESFYTLAHAIPSCFFEDQDTTVMAAVSVKDVLSSTCSVGIPAPNSTLKNVLPRRWMQHSALSLPAAVITPSTEEEIIAVVKYASDDLCVLPTGGGPRGIRGRER